MRTRLIIIAVPPEPLATVLTGLIRRVSTLTAAREASRYPPHVTLRTGAIVPDGEIDRWLDGFTANAAAASPAEITGRGPVATSYRVAGEDRRFIGYEVDRSPSLLALHRHLLRWDSWIKGEQGAFNPHLSIAYGDLTRAAAASAAERLGINGARRGNLDAPGEIRWTCREAGIYHRTGERWEERAVIQLGR